MANDTGPNHFTDDLGRVFHLGNIRPPAGLAKVWTPYGTTPDAPMIEQPEWKQLVLNMNGQSPDYLYIPDDIKNQGPIGMCNCAATGDAMETQRKKQGLSPVTLSAGDLYHRICYNGGDNGSLLEDGLAAVTDPAGGMAPTNVVPYQDWRSNHGDAATAARPNYRVLKAYLCPEFRHCYSASIMGFSIITGIEWFANYMPGPDGWLPRPSRNVGGHAIHGYKPTFRMVGGNIEYGIWHRQSWGPGFGPFNEKFVVPQRAYEGGMVGGWWAVLGTTDQGGGVPPLSA